MPPILMGNHTYMNVIEKESINIRDETFNDVLCVPHLTNNLLSIYQITYGATRKAMEFTIDSIIFRDLESGDIISIGVVDHASRLYSFSNFIPINDFDSSNDDHTSSVDSNIEEKFGYLNLCILTCDPILEPCIPYPHIDITHTLTHDDACVATVLAFCDSM